jgi:hypothetical protein
MCPAEDGDHRDSGSIERRADRLEPVGRRLGKTGGKHGDGGRGAPPNVEYPSAKRDPVRSCGHLRQEHPRVVPPALGHEEPVVAQRFGPIGHVQHDRTPRLHGRQATASCREGTTR